jgi:hypothetical protein
LVDSIERTITCFKTASSCNCQTGSHADYTVLYSTKKLTVTIDYISNIYCDMPTSLRDTLPSADTVHTEYNSLVSYVGNIHCRKIQGSWNGHQATQFPLAVHWLQFYSSTLRFIKKLLSHVHVIIITVNLFNEHVNPTMKFPIMTFKSEL